MQLIPQVAASIDVDAQRLETALAMALDTPADRTADWRGLRLELGHHCRHALGTRVPARASTKTCCKQATYTQIVGCLLLLLSFMCSLDTVI